MKKTLLPLVLALCFATSSCLGPDSLYSSVRDWNVKLSKTDWVNEVVYLGLIVIPVYPLALAGDVLIFNPVAYWTGKGLINEPGPFPGFTRKDNERSDKK